MQKPFFLVMVAMLFLVGVPQANALSNTQSLSLNGSNRYAAITNASSTNLNLSGDFTVEGWVKLNALPASVPFTIVDKAPNPGGYRVMLGPSSTNKMRVLYWDASGIDTQIDSTADIITSSDLGKWVHLAVAVNASGKTASVYKNGVSVSTSQFTSGASSVGTSTNSFSIGAANVDSSPVWYLNGLLDEVQLWSTARSQPQIQSDMVTALNGNETNLNGYWNVNNSLADATANSNHLTGYGSTTYSQEPAHILACTFDGSGNFIGSLLQFLSCNIEFF